MTGLARLLLLGALLGALPGAAQGLSAVFDGDPIDATHGLPYEILPGKPLVQPGPDGALGTADDITTPAIVGDIDLVVRAGAVSAGAIPTAALAGGALPRAVAGARGAGGSEIAFTVFLSDGIVSAETPAGRRLAAADMNGLPVIVAAFPDLDGDGIIGPTLQAAGSDALALELRELEPVGRAAALFGNGVAQGSLAVRQGLAASRGGLRVALVAMALTGPLDPAFFDGAIPAGPAIATALPFLPQRDLARLVRDRAVPAGPDTTLQQLIQFAAVPPPDAYTLRLDGSEPSIDGAIIESQAAVRVGVRNGAAARDVDLPLDHLSLGTEGLASVARLWLVPVDRFDNPADPPPGFVVSVAVDGPLRLLAPRALRRGAPLLIRNASGVRVAGRTVGAGTGTVRVERDGIAVAALPYAVDAVDNQPRADLYLPNAAQPDLQAGIDTATDVNHDGHVVVAVRAGVHNGALVIRQPLQLIGAGRGRTILLGDGGAPVLTASAPGVIVRGVTAIGGTRGFALGSGAQLVDSLAWRNLGDGVLLSGAAASVRQSEARENGGDGVRAAAGAVQCSDNELRDNSGFGASVAAADSTWRANRVVRNGLGGLLLDGADGATASDNRVVLNVGNGIELRDAPSARVIDNLCAFNDGTGLRIDSSDGVFVSGNDIDTNNGYGIFLRRSADIDFAATPGAQPPPGDNRAVDNRKGDVFIRPD
ncbi:MAG: right-handed parallel beta-helix repeat-containing protein [bacterium]